MFIESFDLMAEETSRLLGISLTKIASSITRKWAEIMHKNAFANQPLVSDFTSK